MTRIEFHRNIGVMWHDVYGALLIFGLRLLDVPFATVRTMLMVKGRKLPVALLAFFESLIWVFAITRVLKDGLDDPVRVGGYALGFAAGTVLGMTIENWLAFGKVMVRVISEKSAELRTKLLNANFGVTAIRGEGRDGEVMILFVVLKRRRQRELLRHIRSIDPEAFITIEHLGDAHGGFVEAPLNTGRA